MIIVRGESVLLDRDVAALYGVETKVLNQAVKRNAERFADGYMLTMTPEECSRSQIVTLIAFCHFLPFLNAILGICA